MHVTILVLGNVFKNAQVQNIVMQQVQHHPIFVNLAVKGMLVMVQIINIMKIVTNVYLMPSVQVVQQDISELILMVVF